MMIRKIGIIGAMEEEVEALRERLVRPQRLTRASMDFYSGTLEGHEVVIVRSGIGKVNAGICTQILADDFHIDAVINTGIAGSLKAEINIGDIVLSTDTMHHDMDAREFGYPAGQIPRMDTLAFPADEGLRKLAGQVCRQVNPEIGVWEGRVVSGDQFVADKAKKEAIISITGGSCTEMEGAAIGQAAYLNHIPYLVIRAISDKADDSAQMDYPTFEKQAILHSVRLVESMMGLLD